MRKSIVLTVIAILVFFSTFFIACSNMTPVETVDTYIKAWGSKNANTVAGLESENLWEFYYGQPTDREQRKEDVKNGFDMMRQQQTDTVRTNIEIELISQSDTSAVVQASYTIQRYQNGAELESAFDVHKQYTLIMSNGKWLISSTGSI